MMHPHLPAIRLARFMLLAILCASLLRTSRSADPPAVEKPKTPDVKMMDLAKLKNEDLLKQAEGIYGKSSDEYLASMRALAGIEAQLADARKSLDEFKPPPAPKKEENGNLEKAKAAVDAAKIKVEVAKQQLKLVQTVRGLLERSVSAADAAQSAASVFVSAIDDLKPYAVEFVLREKDGTLGGSARFSPDDLAKKRAE
ncbi:MAG: hypothetical protein L0241_04510, partial [Planctomycetia bacterium]|nr:hypothetical protein [Planctomycetia bacterium]